MSRGKTRPRLACPGGASSGLPEMHFSFVKQTLHPNRIKKKYNAARSHEIKCHQKKRERRLQRWRRCVVVYKESLRWSCSLSVGPVRASVRGSGVVASEGHWRARVRRTGTASRPPFGSSPPWFAHRLWSVVGLLVRGAVFCGLWRGVADPVYICRIITQGRSIRGAQWACSSESYLWRHHLRCVSVVN